MKVETCEQYVLNELENTRNELYLVKKELEEKDKYIKRTYYRLFNNLLGYIVNVELDCNDDGIFEVKNINFGKKENAMFFEVLNDNHLDLNKFISKLNKGMLGDECAIYKQEVDNIFTYASQLNTIVNCME